MDKVSGEDKRLDEAVSCVASTVDCAIAWAIASLSRCDGDLKASRCVSNRVIAVGSRSLKKSLYILGVGAEGSYSK